jgi:hypothetical protein
VRQGSAYQPLSYDIRLPDEIQAEALRLLQVSREAINAALVQLWPHLDAFMATHLGPAWKQAEVYVLARSGHGNRLERCELEQAGRIMRAQAERKQVFLLVQPILTDSFIRRSEDKRPASKNRKQIKEAITVLQKSLDDDETSFVTMQNVVEQCCNYFLQGCWRLYEARNRELAHLAANLLLLFAQVWGCSLISGESLKTLKSTGRGKGVRGKWRNWRNNTTIRAEIWRILRYKCHLVGIRFRSEKPRPIVLLGFITEPILSNGGAGSGVKRVATMPTAITAQL